MKLLTEQQLSYLSRSQFFADQLIMTLPSFFIWVAGFICLVAKQSWTKIFRAHYHIHRHIHFPGCVQRQELLHNGHLSSIVCL